MTEKENKNQCVAMTESKFRSEPTEMLWSLRELCK